MADNTYFQIYKDNAGEWRWRYRSANHKIIGVSSEGYTTKYGCQNSVGIMRKCHDAPVHEGSDAKVKFLAATLR